MFYDRREGYRWSVTPYHPEGIIVSAQGNSSSTSECLSQCFYFVFAVHHSIYSHHGTVDERQLLSEPFLYRRCTLHTLFHQYKLCAFQWSGTYSPWCGSVLGKIKASMCSLLISSRKAFSLSAIVTFSIFCYLHVTKIAVFIINNK